MMPPTLTTMMKTPCGIAALLTLALVAAPAEAGRPSGVGAAPFPSASGHQVAAGWPSVRYDWWNRGSTDRGLGAELVYGDWSGAYTDVEVGFAVNGRFRWRLEGTKRASVGLLLSPGILMAATEGRSDNFIFGARSEVTVPVSVSLHRQVNLLTGAAVPVTVVFLEEGDPYVVLPLMGRIGVEITADPTLIPWVLLELGPALAFGDGGIDTELSFRVWAGITLW